MSDTYLTTAQLSERIHYDPRTIRDQLKDSVLLEGIHYIRPFGGRKLLFIWDAIERDIGRYSAGGSDLDDGSVGAATDGVPADRAPQRRARAHHARIRTSGAASIPMAAGGVCHV